MVGGLGENNISYSNEGFYKSSYLSEIKKNEQTEKVDGKISPQENIQKTLDSLKTKSPDETKSIISNIPIELLVLAYKNPQHLNGLRDFPLENKIAIIELLGENTKFLDAVRQGNQVDTDIRITIKRAIFNTNIESENKEWIKKIVTSSKENREKIGKIEKYFVVSQIINGLGYDRNVISKDKKIIKQSTIEKENYPDDYTGIGTTTNEIIARCFLNKMLDVGKYLKNASKQGIISQQKLDIIWSYANSGGKLVGLIRSLSYLDEENQKRINNLSDSGLLVFLDKLNNDPDIKEKINNIIGYSVDEKFAKRVAQLLVTESSIQNIFKIAEQELKDNPNFQSTEEFQRIRNDYITGKAKKLYEAKLIKESPDLLDVNGSLKKRKIEEKWNSLSSEEKLVYQKEASKLNSQEELNIFNEVAQRGAQKATEELARVKAKKDGVDFDQLTSNEKQIRMYDVSDVAVKNYIAPYTSKERMIIVEQQLNTVRNQNDQELLIAAEKYGFSGDLKKVRGEEYYQKVESQYLQSYDQNFSQTESNYQKSNLGSVINGEIFGNINNENKIFGDRKISEETLKGGLSEEDYKKYFNKIYPNEKIKNTGEIENTKQEKPKDGLYNDTNKIIKKEFKNRIIYFLGNCFDVKLDNESQETLLKSFNFEEKDSGEKKDNGEISLTGKDKNGKKIKIYYNTETGLVNVGKWINVDNNSDSVDIDKKDENNLSFVKGPRIDDFYDKAKRIGYSDILKNDKINSSDDYKKEVINQLKILAPLENQGDIAKEELNKNFLINIALQDVADVIGIRDLVEKGSEISSENKKLFSLLSRSFSTYDKKQIDDFRGVLKFITNYNEEVLSKKNLDKKSPQYIDNQLDDLEKSISNDNYKNVKDVTKILFEKINKEKESGSFNGGVLNSFFSSFLSNKEGFSGSKNSIIDTNKLLTYHEDLSQENKTDQEVEYISVLNENMSPYLAEYGIDEDLKLVKPNIT
ncbi:MAG: hypothetical protein PHR61_00440 [Candidatus Absconditabacteria bacterium]|nr:hypothetical protein [Candidatus Absconditabacteria bacterium]